MDISLERFRGGCSCGRDHAMQTKAAVIEPGAVGRLREVVEGLSLPGKGCIVCDRNTEPYADQVAAELAGMLCGAGKITLNPEGLHADEKAVAAVEAAFPVGCGWLVAVGSGTIHDTTRYVAHANGIEFISFPTAASVDGFLSSVSAMTWYGFKTTKAGISPVALVADSDIFSRAPYRLTAAGIGDVLGKYTSLIDWETSHILTGEDYCPEIHRMSREAVDNVMAALDSIKAGDATGCERLMYALCLSGIAMQLWGNSRPASGAEHHMSHLWEMHVINPEVDALHGEKVGVGLLHVAEVYVRMAAIDDIAGVIHSYGGFPEGRLRERFGDLYDGIARENTPDPLAAVSPDTLVARFEKVRAVLGTLPDPGELRSAMELAGCLTTMEQLGLDPSILAESLELSPYVRGKLTMMRVSKLLNL